MNLAYTIGRMMFGSFFLYSGINHFKQQEHMKQYAASKQVPMPGESVLGTGALLTLAGASLIAGVKPQLGAAGVATFLAGVSPMMHDFWNVEDPARRQNEMIHFSKNMAMLGAALALLGAANQDQHVRMLEERYE